MIALALAGALAYAALAGVFVRAGAAAAEPECVPVPPARLALIGSVLKPPAARLGPAFAVRSADYARVWYLSALVEHDGQREIATWAATRLEDGGVVYAVGATALALSDLPDGARTKGAFTRARHGFAASRLCVNRAVKW